MVDFSLMTSGRHHFDIPKRFVTSPEDEEVNNSLGI